MVLNPINRDSNIDSDLNRNRKNTYTNPDSDSNPNPNFTGIFTAWFCCRREKVPENANLVNTAELDSYVKIHT